LSFARNLGEGEVDVDTLWSSFLEYEAQVMLKYGKTEQIHG